MKTRDLTYQQEREKVELNGNDLKNRLKGPLRYPKSLIDQCLIQWATESNTLLQMTIMKQENNIPNVLMPYINHTPLPNLKLTHTCALKHVIIHSKDFNPPLRRDL